MSRPVNAFFKIHINGEVVNNTPVTVVNGVLHCVEVLGDAGVQFLPVASTFPNLRLGAYFSKYFSTFCIPNRVFGLPISSFGGGVKLSAFPGEALFYIGGRITPDDRPFYDRMHDAFVQSKSKRPTRPSTTAAPLPLADIIRRQACPPLPSGQMPPMYAQLHMSYPKNRTVHLEPFSSQFHDNYIDPKHGNVVLRFLPPLQDVGLEPFEPYSDEDIAIMVPHRI
jgi:hypothetical protein